LADAFPRTDAPRTGSNEPARIPASQLLAGRREVILQHDGQEYRLRLTSNGKLILTK
jgi:hemin uptake protein HemP